MLLDARRPLNTGLIAEPINDAPDRNPKPTPCASRGTIDPAAVKAVVSAPVNGQIIESNAYRVEATGAWRMTVRVKRAKMNEPTELRGFLQRGDDVLTETWSNLIPAE